MDCQDFTVIVTSQLTSRTTHQALSATASRQDGEAAAGAFPAAGALDLHSHVCKTARDHSPRLRIGFMTDTYLPVRNGVTHMVSLLARTLADWGHEPHIFTFAPPGPDTLKMPGRERTVREESNDEVNDGIHVHHAPALPLLRSGYFLGTHYPSWMEERLREMDILHVHHPFISGRLARRLRRVEQPLIFTNQTRYDIYGHYLHRVVPFVPVEVLSSRLTRRAARFANRCDTVIAPAASMADLLRAWGVVSPIEVIYNGIELERFHAAHSSSQNARQNAPTDTEDSNAAGSLVVYLGRLAPEKNVEMLLDAFALAHRAAPTARLLLIGDGPSDAELKQHVQELGLQAQVQFAGALPYDRVPAALAQADVFASASVSEVHPLVFIEAMAIGLPCIGTLSPGVRDTVVDGRNGWLTEPSPESLAVVLIAALQDAGERTRRGEQALQDSRRYNIEDTAAQTLQLYQQALARKQ
jgi:1,2-diacylglycerol 3-alpha-glucosyltransferase